MRNSLNIFTIVAVFFLFSSCSLDDGTNFHFLPLQIVSAELPDSFNLNETYQIRVQYAQPNACTGFAGLEVVDIDTTVRNVAVVGTERTDQEVCAQLVTIRTATFNFIVNYSQTYTFRFLQGENENGEQMYLEVEVPVN